MRGTMSIIRTTARVRRRRKTTMRWMMRNRQATRGTMRTMRNIMMSRTKSGIRRRTMWRMRRAMRRMGDRGGGKGPRKIIEDRGGSRRRRIEKELDDRGSRLGDRGSRRRRRIEEAQVENRGPRIEVEEEEDRGGAGGASRMEDRGSRRRRRIEEEGGGSRTGRRGGGGGDARAFLGSSHPDWLLEVPLPGPLHGRWVPWPLVQ